MIDRTESVILYERRDGAFRRSWLGVSSCFFRGSHSMTNVGNADRVIRFLAGIVLVAAVFVPQLAAYFDGWGNWKYAVTAVGAVLLVTAIVRVCPAYSALGINTGAKA